MDTSDFDKSRDYKERSFDLVSKICEELQTIDERLYPAYAERGISRIQDKRYEESEADRRHYGSVKLLVTTFPGQMKSVWAGYFLHRASLKSATPFFWIVSVEKRHWARMIGNLSGLD